ncbi:MAG: MFS transporter, partial [Treponema sp.]|nr:MFS transporter [Treponema sp.]
GEKMGFAAFSASNNVVYIFKSMYYQFFLTDVVKVSLPAAMLILTIGILWDAINDPLIGFWAVNRKFKNGERVRPYTLWFSLPWAITVVLLFTSFGTTGKVTLAIAIAVYLIFELFNTIVGIPYNSMGGLATNVDADRRSINAFRNLGACVGSAVGAVASLPLFKLFGAMAPDGTWNHPPLERGFLYDPVARAFLFVAVILGVIVAAGSVAHYVSTRERVRAIAEEEPRLSPLAIARMLFGCRSWVFNTLYEICYFVTNTLLMTYITYYAKWVINAPGAATLIQAAYLSSMIVTSFLVGPVDRLLGRRKTMMLGVAIGLAGKIWFLFEPLSRGAILVNAAAIGISVTIAFILFNTNRNNIADIIEWKDGRRLDSMVSTADNFISKIAVAGVTQVGLFVLNTTGYNADLAAQPPRVVNAINALLGWFPLGVAVLMLLAAFFIPIERDLRRIRE